MSLHLGLYDIYSWLDLGEIHVLLKVSYQEVHVVDMSLLVVLFDKESVFPILICKFNATPLLKYLSLLGPSGVAVKGNLWVSLNINIYVQLFPLSRERKKYSSQIQDNLYHLMPAL